MYAVLGVVPREAHFIEILTNKGEYCSTHCNDVNLYTLYSVLSMQLIHS